MEDNNICIDSWQSVSYKFLVKCMKRDFSNGDCLNAREIGLKTHFSAEINNLSIISSSVGKTLLPPWDSIIWPSAIPGSTVTVTPACLTQCSGDLLKLTLLSSTLFVQLAEIKYVHSQVVFSLIWVQNSDRITLSLNLHCYFLITSQIIQNKDTSHLKPQNFFPK